jgi:hypothetical protein
MHFVAHRPEAPSAIRSDLGAILVSLELSRLTWLITSLSPGGSEKMSKHSVPAGSHPIAECDDAPARLKPKESSATRPVI